MAALRYLSHPSPNNHLHEARVGPIVLAPARLLRRCRRSIALDIVSRRGRVPHPCAQQCPGGQRPAVKDKAHAVLAPEGLSERPGVVVNGESACLARPRAQQYEAAAASSSGSPRQRKVPSPFECVGEAEGGHRRHAGALLCVERAADEHETASVAQTASCSELGHRGSRGGHAGARLIQKTATAPDHSVACGRSTNESVDREETKGTP